MSKCISVFPKINQQMFEELDYSYEDAFFTRQNSKKIHLIPIDAIDSNNEIVLVDSDEDPWSMINGNLTVEREISIENCQRLFGAKGVACKSAEIGIGLRWTSKESRQRGVEEICTIKNKSKTVTEKIELTFPRSFLKSNLTLETIVYVKKKGVPEFNETILGNKEGLVLGELDFINIRLDGKGSEFPILEEENNDPSNPLWSVNVDWEYPAISPFSDSFQIYINKKNANYKYVDKNDDFYDPHLMVEIVASALTILVLKLKEDSNSWDEMEKNINIEEGSVSHAVYHFLHNLHMNFDNPITIHESFRKYYEQAGSKND